jgi:3-oxoadipate enol-lactonase
MERNPMPFAQLPDTQLHYEWTGPEHAPILLFSNSLGATLQMWNAQIADFTSHFRVLRYDTRGHGQSPATPGPYTIEQLSGDVLHLLDVLEIQQVHFCGLSMGGLTGMFLGVHAPERLHKMVLCNTAAQIGTTESWNTRIENVNEHGMKPVAAVVIEKWLTAKFRSDHPAQSAVMQSMLEHNHREGYIANCAAVRDADFRENLRGLKVPTLIVAGTHDPVTTPADGRFLAERITGASFTELSAAHISNVEAQNEFNREVLAFLLA